MIERKATRVPLTDILSAFVIGIFVSILSVPILINLEIKIPIFIIPLLLMVLFPLGVIIGFYIGLKIPVLYQFAKFVETGVLNTAVDFGVLNLLIFFIGTSTGLIYSMLKAASFAVATLNSYLWNKLWVFGAVREGEKRGEISEKTGEEFGKFIIVSLIGLVINVAAASIVVFASRYSGTSVSEKLWANIGAAGGSVSAMMWNFVGYKKLVFKK